MTNPNSDFLKYRDLPWQQYILPIVPAGAKLSEESGLTADHLGKIPGTWSRTYEVWYGFHGWQRHHTTKPELERWQNWQKQEKGSPGVPVAIGIRLFPLIGFDIDINDPAVAAWVEVIAVLTLGQPIVVRERDGSCRIMPFYLQSERAALPITKRRIFFMLPETGDEKHLVEILGHGQQAVIEGPHAKGAMHRWRNGRGLTDIKKGEISPHSVITIEKIVRFYQLLTKGIEERGGTVLAAAKGRTGEPRDEWPIDSPNNPHQVKPDELPTLTAAIKAIDLNHASLAHYDDFFKLLLAICASVSGDLNYFHEVVWPWLETNDKNMIEYCEGKWRNDCKTSSLGPDYVYHVAARFGCEEAQRAITNATDLAALYGPPVEPEPGGLGSDSGGRQQGESANSGVVSGPLPAGYSDVHVLQSFLDTKPPYRYIIERRDPFDGWVKQENGLWVPAYPEITQAMREHCSEIGDWYRTQSGQRDGAKIDLALKNIHTHDKLLRAAAKTPELAVSLKDFDTANWLLNTPAEIVDIRTLEGRPHAHHDLMLMQTSVNPAWEVLERQTYETACPHWMAYVRFLANGDDRVLRLLRRFGAYTATGYAQDLYMLFMWGEPNSGKSAFQDVLALLLGNYIRALSQYFLMRQMEKRTFELSQLIGKRGAFAGEVPKGGSWDTQMISTMLNGKRPLSAEGKGTRFIEFRNTAKILVAGNHQPNFISHSEKDGLDRRFLMLEFHRDIAEVFTDDRDWAAKVVAAEGPAILAWFLDDAYQGYQDLNDTGSFMGGTQQIGLEIARKHRLKANTHNQMIDQELVRGPEATIPAKDFWERYKDWGRRNELWRATRVESYEECLTALRNLGFKVAAPTDHKKGRAMLVYGLRAPTLGDDGPTDVAI